MDPTNALPELTAAALVTQFALVLITETSQAAIRHHPLSGREKVVDARRAPRGRPEAYFSTS